jgi:hypothetical protein
MKNDFIDSKVLKIFLKGSSKLRVIELDNLPKVTGYSDIFAEYNLEHQQYFSTIVCGFRRRAADVLRQCCPKIRNIHPFYIEY